MNMNTSELRYSSGRIEVDVEDIYKAKENLEVRLVQKGFNQEMMQVK
jgi:hypothetical protein